VGTLPDAPTLRCQGCGKNLRVPAQFRPSVMASQRHVRRPDRGAQHSSTSVLPEAAAPAATARAPSPSAAAAPRGPRPGRPVVDTAAKAGPQPVAFPLRLLAWAVALVLGLLLTGWLARVSGWLSGDRLVDVFTGTGGMERYLRVLALAPAWAVVTTLLLTLFLEGGRALARRRNAVRPARGESRRGNRRARPPRVDPSVDVERDGAVGDGLRRRGAARRGSR
jgi:hypothetical protein